MAPEEINGIPEESENSAPVLEEPMTASEAEAGAEDDRSYEEDFAEARAEEDAQDEFEDEDEVTEAETQADDSGSEPPAEPEAPAEAEAESEPEIPAEDLIAQAVGISFANFSKRHPMTARHLKNRIGNPVDIVIRGLMEDEAFKSLMSRTAEAIDVADIVKVITGIALKVAERILTTL